MSNYKRFVRGIALAAAAVMVTACPGPFADDPTMVTVTACSVDGRTDVLLSETFWVTFSAAMSEAETQAAFSLEPAIGGTFAWSADATEISFDPSTDLLAETQYTVQISTGASDAEGNPLSETYTATFTTIAPLAAPTNLVTVVGPGCIDLSWNPVPLATSYNLYWSTSPGAGTEGTKIPGVSSPYLHAPLADGLPYYYVVTAQTPAGEGLASAEASGTPHLGTPGGFSASAGLASVTLTWEAVPGVDQYNLYWSATPGGTAAGTKIPDVTAPHTHSSLTNGETYYYAVTAEYDLEEGTPSGEQSAMAGHVLLAEVPFADSNMWNARFLPEEAIYADEVVRLFGSKEDGREAISDLSGIEYLWNLSVLSMRDNNISTLAPLANLQELSSVNMDGNASLTDIEAVSSLQELWSLSLIDCPLVDDISALSIDDPFGRDGLSELYLDGTSVSDLSPLLDHWSLMTLDITNCPVSDSTYLAQLTQLSRLMMGYTQLANPSSVSALEYLDALDMSGYSLPDLSFLSGLDFLYDLRLSDCDLTSISSLGTTVIENLGHLDVSDNDIAALGAPLPVNLSTLEISSNLVTDLSPVMSIPGLWALGAASNGIVDVSAISGHAGLVFVILNDNSITTGVASLASLTQAVLIDLSGNPGIPPEDMETLRAALSGCEILPE